MQYIDCYINPTTRIVSYPGATTIVQRDTNVEVLRFHFSLSAEYELENDSIRIMVLKNGQVNGFNAENVRVETNDGGDEELVFEHTITTHETATPGQIAISVCGNQVSGNNITEAWHTLNMTFQVASAAHSDSDEGEDTPETIASNAEKIAALQTLVDAVTSGRPIPVKLKSQMTDTSAIYLYTGTETGEQHNYWYYHDGTSWVPGSEYGGITIDDALSSTSENAVQNKVIKAKYDELNGRLGDLSLHPVKNLVTELLPLSTNQVLAGRTVTLSEADVQRATAVIDVEGGKTYTVNQIMSNNFSGFADADGKWIGQVNDYKTADYIFTAPQNAVKLYLCNTGWTVNQGLVVLEGDTPIMGTTKTEYPFDTVVRLEPSVPIEPYDTEITGLEADKNFLLTQMDAQGVTFGQGVPVFSGNASKADPVIVTVGRIYYKSKKATGDMYLSSDDLKNLSFSIGSGQGLVFDYDTKTAYVTDNMTVTSYSLQNKVVLVWKQGVTIKGAWAWIYADTVIKNGLTMFNRSITKRLMQRQGEGYGLPDNSLEAVKTALKDGWNNIKISVANTSDNVVYCTHSYEMRNNKALDLNYVTVKATGEVYDGNVAINNVTSSFIDTLQYKGYDIPTLDTVLAYICRFDTKLTIEIKDRMSATAVQNMLDSCAFYGVTPVYSCDRYNAEDLLAVSTDVDVAAVFYYSAENAQTAYTTYKDRCKSLRFDIVYGDTVPKADVVAWHNLGVKFKLGGRQPTQAMWEDAIHWCDDIEVYGKNQTWIDRLINETW